MFPCLHCSRNNRITWNIKPLRRPCYCKEEVSFYDVDNELKITIPRICLVKYFPLDITDEENISDLLLMIDNVIQFGEDQDVKVKDFDELENETEDE